MRRDGETGVQWARRGTIIHVGLPSEKKNVKNIHSLEPFTTNALEQGDKQAQAKLRRANFSCFDVNRKSVATDATKREPQVPGQDHANDRCNECKHRNLQCLLMIDEETAVSKG